MKKILILINQAVSFYKFRFELIQRLVDENFDVYISSPQNEDNDYVKKITSLGVKHFHTDMDRRGINFKNDLNLIKQYKELIKSLKPDIILTYTIKPNVFGSYAAKAYKIPVIMNVTGVGSALYESKLKILFKYLYRSACKRSRIVFFQNESNRNFLTPKNTEKYFKSELLPGSGVNLLKFSPLEKTVMDDKIKFLFIGRLMKEKGIEEYLKAAESISDKYKNVEFQILGYLIETEEDNSYRSKLEKMPYINFLGSSDDVRNEIREIDCLINPSYHEGMSNVLQEAAAMGKPLIAGNISGCREIIDDGVNGFLFEVKNIRDLEEKIIKFIELSNEEKIIMGKNSRLKVEKEFDRNIVIEKYLKEINSLIGSKGKI